MYSMVAPARGTLYFYLLCTITRASVSMRILEWRHKGSRQSRSVVQGRKTPVRNGRKVNSVNERDQLDYWNGLELE